MFLILSFVLNKLSFLKKILDLNRLCPFLIHSDLFSIKFDAGFSFNATDRLKAIDGAPDKVLD